MLGVTSHVKLVLLIGAGVLLGSALVATWYFIRVERLTCDLDFRIGNPDSKGLVQVSCSEPRIELRCVGATLSRFGDNVKCETLARDRYRITDHMIIRNNSCETLSGQGAYYGGNEECKCRDGFVMTDGTCVNMDFNCRQRLGENGIFDTGKRACGCRSGSAIDHATGSCRPVTELCQSQFGPGAEATSGSTDDCICANRHVWNAAKNRCICPPNFSYERDGKCMTPPSCGGGGEFDIARGECRCKPGFKLVDGKCPTPDELCLAQLGLFAAYSAQTGSCHCQRGFKQLQNSFDKRLSRCEGMVTYCLAIYGPRASPNPEVDDECKCLGAPCQCPTMRDRTDRTPCV